MPSNLPNTPRYLSDFTEPKKMGRGKNASMRVKGPDGFFYQLKNPISGQAVTKRVWAGNTDKENVGELASACIVNALIKPAEAHLYPKVLVFYHYKNSKPKKDANASEQKSTELVLHEKSIYIASTYLRGDPGGVKNLDEFMLHQLGLDPDTKGHVKFVAGQLLNPQSREIGIDSPLMKPLIPSFCRALVISAILGDHDVNPGNLMAITRDGITLIGRIDYGHGFNDLINTKVIFGGGLRDQLHPVKDFFNRTNVGGANIFKQGSESKVWRDYQGLVFTFGMADSLMAAQEMTDDHIRAGVQEFISMMGTTTGTVDTYRHEEGVTRIVPGEPGGILYQMDNAKTGSKVGQLKLLSTLEAMYEAINGKSLGALKGSTATDQAEMALAKVGEAMARFIGRNRDDAILTGRLMKAQLAIREMVASGFSTDEINTELGRQNLVPIDKCYLMKMYSDPLSLSDSVKEQFRGNPTYVLHDKTIYYIDI